MTARSQSAFELRGWHVLLILAGFFAAVIAVDVLMAVKAYATFPGEVTDRPYEEGLAFNRTLATRAQEKALGWQARVEVAPQDVGRSQIRLIVTDAAGEPVRRLKLKARLERPATESGRLEPRFTETRPGVYVASVPDTPGAWDLSVTGTDSEGRPFEAGRRLQWR
jgi:nitrogen fixation protein FixH